MHSRAANEMFTKKWKLTIYQTNYTFIKKKMNYQATAHQNSLQIFSETTIMVRYWIVTDIEQ